MAFLNETFRTAELPESDRNFDPLPPGWYQANITKTEIKKTKNGTGQYIAVRYDITGPSHQGRVVFANLNIRNASPEAERIGRQQLGELLRAIGLAELSDTDQLIGAPVQIKLKVREQEGYDPSNDIAGFKSVDGAKPVEAKQAQAAQPAQSAKSAPWARK